MSKKERRTCIVSDGDCTAPAGVGVSGVGWADGDGSARATCWYCGEPVCGQCSRLTRRTHTGRQRICAYCWPKVFGEDMPTPWEPT